MIQSLAHYSSFMYNRQNINKICVYIIIHSLKFFIEKLIRADERLTAQAIKKFHIIFAYIHVTFIVFILGALKRQRAQTETVSAI